MTVDIYAGRETESFLRAQGEKVVLLTASSSPFFRTELCSVVPPNPQSAWFLSAVWVSGAHDSRLSKRALLGSVERTFPLC
jgi:hypothetical protein